MDADYLSYAAEQQPLDNVSFKKRVLDGNYGRKSNWEFQILDSSACENTFLIGSPPPTTDSIRKVSSI